ncbi:MAG: aspartate-semialdehyde dehydrogenase, partial [Pirellulaceae bacterium]
MKRVGLVGWRGMVGSVLMDRMQAEGDFAHIEPVFFTTSNVGGAGPQIGGQATGKLLDAKSPGALQAMDIVLTCQGGEYTNQVHPQLRSAGWNGYWIDAASSLRMNDDAVVVLDPVNRHVIDAALARGVKDYVGGNCTVSLMLMGLQGLFQAGPKKENLVEWLTSMTYQ